MGRASGLPDLVVVHRDGRAARVTIERLSRAGVDGRHIELVGRTEVVTAGRDGDRQTDGASARSLLVRALAGLAWGTLLGAVLGLAVFALAAPASAVALAAGAAGGAAFGASVGMITGLLTAPTMVGPWERTFAPLLPGGVVVGIRVDSPRTQHRAWKALRGRRARSVREVVDLDALPDEPLEP